MKIPLDMIQSSLAFQRLYRIYQKHRESLLYLFFGGLTVLIGIGLFAALYEILHINELVANVVSWIGGVTFSFFTNRKWVFRANTSSVRGFAIQLVSFYSARIGTLLLQETLLYIFISRLNFPGMLIKICTEFINIILNYLASKFFIFRNRG